ncbi:MAG: putative Ig domain-containing protein, partial [Verrucomicrobiota bacterium]
MTGLATPAVAQTSFSTNATDISNLTGGDAPYSIDSIRGALQIDAAVVAYRDVWAAATVTPGLVDGLYDVKVTSMREFDGESPYQLLVNGRVVGTRVNGTTDEDNDYALEDHLFLNVPIPAGATVTVRSQAVTNGLIPEGNGTAYSRGRWTTLEIQPAGTFDNAVVISGDQMQWHKVTLTIDGPSASESDTSPNPFYDYRMQVTFSNGTTQISVPGYFAADGAAAETSATSGSKWRAHFMPTLTGVWTYEVDFRSGSAVAITNSPSNFPEVSPYDGITGSFPVTVSDKSGDDFRSPDKGRLRYSGKAFPEWMGSGSAFVKAAVNSPELLLEYDDFDNTNSNRSYSTHFSDWTSTDPVWQGDKGKEIIGLMNYISSIGLNSHYFLTMNTAGDGGNAYPWTGSTSFFSYDTSKTDQWQILFDHMMTEGIQVQFVLSEQENQSLFENPVNGGNNELFAPSRRLYYREMVARYGYLNAIIWNIGEENGWDRGNLNNGNDLVNDYEQRISYAAYVESLLAYPDNISIHNGPATDDFIFGEFIDNGIGSYRGISFQGRYEDPFYGHDRIVFWRNSSEAAGTPWIVAYDEPFINSELNSNSEKNNMRENSVWAAFTGGAAGVGIYNGAGFDLTVQDYRLYEDFFEIAVRGKDFFASSFDDIASAVPDDSLVTGNNNWCLAHVNNTYVVYLRDGGTTTLDLSNANGTFDVQWFDPDGNNTNLQNGSVTSVTGGGVVSLGNAPSARNSDWAILVKKANADLSPTILPNSLSSVQAGDYFSSIISVKSGDLPNTFSVSGGALPNGLSLNSATGDLTGTPAVAGDFSFTVQVTDSDGDTDTQAFTLTVNESGSGGQVTVFEEANGLLIIEAENANIDTTWWSEETRVSGFLGDSYIVMDGPSNQFATPGNGTIDYVIEITNAGEYQFQWRSFITDKDGGAFNDNKEHNDNWLRILDSNGTPITPLPVPNFDFNNRNNPQNDDIPDAAGDGWYKVYRNGDVTEWEWQASNQDNDALALIWSFQANETYTVQISARSQGHAIDRLMFWDRSGTDRADRVRGRMSNNQNNTADGLPLSAFTVQQPVNDPQIVTSALADVNQGENYNQTLVAINGETPYTWAVTTGSLPAGLSLNTNTGVISGTPTSSGLSTFTVTVTDTDGRTGSRIFSINVNSVFVPPPFVDGVYIESNNRVVMEAELANFDSTWWTADTRVGDFLGDAYLVMDGPQDNFQTPGIAILDFPFTITNAGNYQFQWRSFITDKNGGPNSSNTDHNDNWVRLVDSSGNPILPVAPVPNFDFENRNNPENDATPDEQSDGWHKVYRNGDTSSWTWQASNQD